MVKIGKTNLQKIKQDKKRLILPFGKHEGEYIEDVPIEYLSFLVEQHWFEEKYQRFYSKAIELLEEFEEQNDLY